LHPSLVENYTFIIAFKELASVHNLFSILRKTQRNYEVPQDSSFSLRILIITFVL